jgi:hypothetical protein
MQFTPVKKRSQVNFNQSSDNFANYFDLVKA